MDATLSTTEFQRAFRTRREYCRALLELSRQQNALIEADDYARLLTLLGHKQRLLSQLDDIGLAQETLRHRWRAERSALAPEEREECEHVLAETEALLAELAEQEQDSTQRLVLRRDATQQQLQAISEGGRTLDAYVEEHSPAAPRCLDVDG